MTTPKEWEEHLNLTIEATKRIKELNPGENSTGKIACPKCQNELHYGIASNGHIRGKCSTDGCLSWMS